jgi:hypothetical protein
MQFDLSTGHEAIVDFLELKFSNPAYELNQYVKQHV